MKIELMRALDRWAGVPMCALASIMSTRKRRVRPIKRIALIKLSELGAIVLAHPLLQRLKQQHPSAEFYFVTFERNKEVLDLLEMVPRENVLAISDHSLGGFLRDALRVISRLRNAKVDAVVDLEFFSRCTAILAFCSGAWKRVGFDRFTFEGLYRGSLLTHKIQYNPLQHITRNYMSFAIAFDMDAKESPEFGSPVDDALIRFPQAAPEKRAAGRLDEKLANRGITREHRLMLVNPGEGLLPLREWPLENFIDVAGRLMGDESCRIVLVGTDKAREKAGLMAVRLGERCIDMTGETDLRELMVLFHRSAALLTNDCGLAHLAMLTPIKKFVIFGPESPQVFGPLGPDNAIIYLRWPCSPCLSALNHRASACRDNRCLKAVSAGDVYKLMKEEIKNDVVRT